MLEWEGLAGGGSLPALNMLLHGTCKQATKEAHTLLPTQLTCARPLQTSTFRKELEDLREMKEDVERREKAQAEVISQQVHGRWTGLCGALLAGGRYRQDAGCCSELGSSPQPCLAHPPTVLCPPGCLPPLHPTPTAQAKRLEELDALYRDEAIMRKKIFNQVGQGCCEGACPHAPPLSVHVFETAPSPSPSDLTGPGRQLIRQPPLFPPCVADGGHEGQDPRVLPRSPCAADGAGPRPDG